MAGFADYSLEEFVQLLERAGFSINESWISDDSLDSGRGICWLNIIAHRE